MNTSRGPSGAANNENDEMFSAWCAGFFDGEGGISCVRSTNRNSRKDAHHTQVMRVHITQAQEQCLLKIQSRFGGRILMVKKSSLTRVRRQVWRWVADGKDNIPFLRAVRPYLLVKHVQADIALKFHETTKSVTGQFFVAPAFRVVRDELEDALLVSNFQPPRRREAP